MRRDYDNVLEDELHDFLTTMPILPHAPLTAPWLLSDWPAPRWLLAKRNGKSRKNKHGEWIDVEIIYWDRILPNGDHLTDPKYADILEDAKRLVYAVRSGPYATVDRSNSQYQLANNLMVLINWMIVRQFDLPITFLRFSSLTPADFNHFCNDVVYGPAALEQWELRIDSVLCNADDETLRNNCDTEGRIDRTWLENQCHIDNGRMKAARVLPPFLEPHENSSEEHLPLPKNKMARGKTGNRALSYRHHVKSYRLSDSRVADLLSTWQFLYRQEAVVGNLLSFDPFSDIAPGRLAIELGSREKGRTPDIPPHIALHYFSSAIKWVVDYGPSIVSYLQQLDAAYAEVRRTRPKAHFDYCAPFAFSMVPIPVALKSLGISRYQAHKCGTSREEICRAPSVVDALHCLVAACFVTIASLTARRKEELLDLTIDCVRDEYDGLDIEFGLLKGSARDILDRVTRPIPALVKLAVDILLDVTKKARGKTKDRVLKRMLYLRNAGQSGRSVQITQAHLYRILDLFADLIDVPLLESAESGQPPYRWYIRPHECRRFLPISYFWHTSKHPSLSALSWFLGHLGPTETLRYLQRNRSGSELSGEAAQATIWALRSDAGREDILRLKKTILMQFNADSLECIEPHQLKHYLANLYAHHNLDIEMHAIASLDEIKNTIAITTKERTDGTPATR